MPACPELKCSERVGVRGPEVTPRSNEPLGNPETRHRLTLLALIHPGEWIQGKVSKQERYGAGVQGGPGAGFRDPQPGTHTRCTELSQNQTVTCEMWPSWEALQRLCSQSLYWGGG